MAESIQHKLDRVRPPRVQITYDVETGGAIEKKELPFVVGIMADLSGRRDQALSDNRPDPTSLNGEKSRKAKGKVELQQLRERRYIEIDRDNFNSVMETVAPRLVFNVKRVASQPYSADEVARYRKENGLRDEDKLPALFKPAEDAGELHVELEFLSLDDFDPLNVIKQVRELRDLLDARNRLSDLLTKLDGNVNLAEQLKTHASELSALGPAQAPAAQPDAAPKADAPAPSPDPKQKPESKK